SLPAPCILVNWIRMGRIISAVSTRLGTPSRLAGKMPRMVRPSQILHSADGPMPAPLDWQTHSPVRLLRNVLRLTAPNPGVMTGPGTNSYLVGEANTGFIAIDPGPAD